MDNNRHIFNKSIYDMELHEELIATPLKEKIGGIGSEFECAPLRILRVPGGWVYCNVYLNSPGLFVPFDNEFQNKS
jgi:hypothetical protein